VTRVLATDSLHLDELRKRAIRGITLDATTSIGTSAMPARGGFD
jgi:hypothetical protein